MSKRNGKPNITFSVTADAQELYKLLAPLLEVAAERTALEVTKCLLLSAGAHGLEAKATNLEQAMRVSMPSQTVTGEAALLARPLLEALQYFKGVCTLAVKHEPRDTAPWNVSLRSEQQDKQGRPMREVTLPAMDPDEYPSIHPNDTSAPQIRLLAGDIERINRRVAWAANLDDVRVALRTINLRPGPEGSGKLRATASDGFRIQSTLVEADAENLPNDLDLCVMPKVFQVLGRLFKKDDVVTVTVLPNKVVFTGNGIELSTVLVDAKFPDIVRYVPRLHSYRVALDRKELDDALALTLSMFQQAGFARTSNASVLFEIQDDELYLAADWQDATRSKTTIPIAEKTVDLSVGLGVKIYYQDPQNNRQQLQRDATGDDLNWMIVDARKFRSAVQAVESDTVALCLLSFASPLLVTEPGKTKLDEMGTFGVVMPMSGRPRDTNANKEIEHEPV